MEYILLGFILGVVFANCYHVFIKTSCGVLKIDHSNPEKDLYLIEIENLEKLDNKREVVLRIDNKADLSQNKQSL